MQRRKILTIGAIPIIAVVLALSAGPAMAAPIQEPAADDTEIATIIANDPSGSYVSLAEAEEVFGVDETEIIESPKSTEGPESTDPEIAPAWWWWGCEWEGRADYPHKTNNQASVHGYWVKLSGTCPSTAKVTVNLQALYCSPGNGCVWINQKTDSGTFTSGSGSGNWATPHADCAGTGLVGWRGEVDVDLTDFADPFGYDYGAAKDLTCFPA